MPAKQFLDGIRTMVGIATRAPIVVPVGTLLTNAVTGAIEHDGTSFYTTPDTAAVGGRGVMDCAMLACQSAVATLSSATGNQRIFGTPTTGALSVAAGTTYLIDALILVNTGTATTRTTSFNFGGTATITSIMFETGYLGAVAGTIAASQSARFILAAGGVMNATNILASSHFKVRGVVRINAAGTLIPQIAFSAAPGATCSIGINSFMKLTPIGNGTVNQIGAWA